MTNELKNDVKAVLQKMSDAGIPGIFLAFSEDHFINFKNCNLQQQAQLLINHIESSDGLKDAFVEELEGVLVQEQNNAVES